MNISPFIARMDMCSGCFPPWKL